MQRLMCNVFLFLLIFLYLKLDLVVEIPELLMHILRLFRGVEFRVRLNRHTKVSPMTTSNYLEVASTTRAVSR